MAGKDTDIIISVGAEADVDSAKKVGKALEKGVFSSIPDGYISIPAKIKVPIKKASPELKEAQEKLIKQWERVFSNKGFSSSKKEVQELDKLNAAYSKFDQLAKKEKKWKSTQYQELSKRMEIPMKEYKLLREELTGVKLKEPKIKSTTKKSKKSKPISTNTKQTKSNYNDTDFIENDLGYKKRSTDLSGGTQETIHVSNKVGGHINPYTSQNYADLYSEDVQKRMKESLQLVAILNEFNKDRFAISKARLDRTALTSEEAHQGLADVDQTKFRDNLSALLKGLVDFKEFMRFLSANMQEGVAHYEEAGKSLDYIINKFSGNMTSFFFRMGGILGVDYTKEGDIPQSEKSYYEDMDKAWRQFNAILDKLQYIKGVNGLDAFESDELKMYGGTHSKNKNKRVRRNGRKKS